MSELTEYEAERAVLDAALAWSGGNADDGTGWSAVALSDAVEDLRAAREPHWVTGRTWADVRAGDTVRLPGAEPVHVLTAAVFKWHVSEQRGPWNADQRAYEVIRQEWSVVGVRLAEYPDMEIMRMQPAGEVEILMTAAECAVTEMIGWSNRAYVTE